MEKMKKKGKMGKKEKIGKMGKMEKMGGMGEMEKMKKKGKMGKMVKCQMQPERRRREGCCSLELRLSTIPCRKISLN